MTHDTAQDHTSHYGDHGHLGTNEYQKGYQNNTMNELNVKSAQKYSSVVISAIKAGAHAQRG
jgi:hypothetical protein